MSAVLNSRGYAQNTVGSLVPATYPGGVYSVNEIVTPSGRLVVTSSFLTWRSSGNGSGNCVNAVSFSPSRTK